MADSINVVVVTRINIYMRLVNIDQVVEQVHLNKFIDAIKKQKKAKNIN